MSERKLGSRLVRGILGLATAGVLSDTPRHKIDSENHTDFTEEIKVEKREVNYLDLLDQSPNFEKIKQRLNEIRISTDGGRELSGYDFLRELFKDGYSLSADRKELDVLVERITPKDFDAVLYVVRVANALWVDKHTKTDWHLADFTPQELEYTFFTSFFNEKGQEIPNTRPVMPLKNRAGFDESGDAWSTQRFQLESAILLRPIAEKLLVPNDQRATIFNMIRWIKSNFFHAYIAQDGTDYGWDRYRDGRDDSIKNKSFGIFQQVSLNRYFEERISGCHDTAMLLSDLLRSVNIPVLNLNIGSGHGVVYISSEKRFVHGDHLSNNPATSPDVMLLRAEQIQYSEEDQMANKALVESAKEKVGDNLAALYMKQGQLQRRGNYLFFEPSLSIYNNDDSRSVINEELAPFQPTVDPVNPHNMIFQPVRIKTLDELRNLDGGL